VANKRNKSQRERGPIIEQITIGTLNEPLRLVHLFIHPRGLSYMINPGYRLTTGEDVSLPQFTQCCPQNVKIETNSSVERLQFCSRGGRYVRSTDVQRSYIRLNTSESCVIGSFYGSVYSQAAACEA